MVELITGGPRDPDDLRQTATNEQKLRQIEELVCARLRRGVWGTLTVRIPIQDGVAQLLEETFSRHLR